MKKPRFSRKNRHQPTKLRSSITPGTILIVLAGRFKGSRVVFLKQLESGLLLVSGPYKLNGVPLRRLNQAYVIATSTSVDVSKVNVADIKDDFFARGETTTAKSGDAFFKEGETKNVVTDAKKVAQKKVDTSLLKAVSAVPQLDLYLKAKFCLKKNDKPHLMKF